MNATDAARLLLSSGAVQLSPSTPFRYASGLRSPIYTDHRLLLALPAPRARLLAALDRLAPRRCHGFAGVATAGIPWAAWLASRRRLPLWYVRASPKHHGKGGQIEGGPVRGKKITVVEDLVSTGASTLAAARALRRAGARVDTALALFTYRLPGTAAAFRRARLRLKTLTHLGALLRAATQTRALSPAQAREVRAWQQDPAAWSRVHGGPSHAL